MHFTISCLLYNCVVFISLLRVHMIVQITTVEEFQEKVISNTTKLAIVDFYADWCGPCRVLAPMLEELVQKYSKQVILYKVNIDELRTLAMEYEIMSIPTVMFFKSGKIIGSPYQWVLPDTVYEEVIKNNI